MNETKANIQNQSTQLHNQVAQLRNLEVQIVTPLPPLGLRERARHGTETL